MNRLTDGGNAAETKFERVGIGPFPRDDGGRQFLQLHVIAETHGVVGVRLVRPLH